MSVPSLRTSNMALVAVFTIKLTSWGDHRDGNCESGRWWASANDDMHSISPCVSRSVVDWGPMTSIKAQRELQFFLTASCLLASLLTRQMSDSFAAVASALISYRFSLYSVMLWQLFFFLFLFTLVQPFTLTIYSFSLHGLSLVLSFLLCSKSSELLTRQCFGVLYCRCTSDLMWIPSFNKTPMQGCKYPRMTC